MLKPRFDQYISESNARARKRQSRKTRETRAISHARGHLCVSRFARRTTGKRETARSLLKPSIAVSAIYLGSHFDFRNKQCGQQCKGVMYY